MWSDRRCYKNSHKDFWGIKGFVILRKIKEEGGKKICFEIRGPKQDRQFQTRTEGKMCSKWCHGNGLSLLCSERNQKKKLIWRQQQLQHCSAGQRHFLPSSVIICMLVPLLLSWLNEITGSFLPGFANGARQVLRGETVTGACQQETKTHTKTALLVRLIKCWQPVIAKIMFSDRLTTT